MKKYIFLAFALFGMLSIGSLVPTALLLIPVGEIRLKAPTLMGIIGIISLIMMGFTLKLIQSIPLL